MSRQNLWCALFRKLLCAVVKAKILCEERMNRITKSNAEEIVVVNKVGWRGVVQCSSMMLLFLYWFSIARNFVIRHFWMTRSSHCGLRAGCRRGKCVCSLSAIAQCVLLGCLVTVSSTKHQKRLTSTSPIHCKSFRVHSCHQYARLHKPFILWPPKKTPLDGCRAAKKGLPCNP